MNLIKTGNSPWASSMTSSPKGMVAQTCGGLLFQNYSLFWICLLSQDIGSDNRVFSTLDMSKVFFTANSSSSTIQTTHCNIVYYTNKISTKKIIILSISKCITFIDLLLIMFAINQFTVTDSREKLWQYTISSTQTHLRK